MKWTIFMISWEYFFGKIFLSSHGNDFLTDSWKSELHFYVLILLLTVLKLNCLKIFWIKVKSCHFTFNPQFGCIKNWIKGTSTDIFNLKWGLSKAWYLKIKWAFFIPHLIFQVFPSNVKFLDLPGISFINIYLPFPSLLCLFYYIFIKNSFFIKIFMLTMMFQFQ